MKSTQLARGIVVLLIAGGFWLWTDHLMSTAPDSKRERQAAEIPLVDVIETAAATRQLRLRAAGTIDSAMELELRPQVAGRILEQHPDFEPGGRIAAGETILTIEADEYRLAVQAAEAAVAKAQATIALERGRRVVAREELNILKGSIKVDERSQSLALRKPQLRQVQAELAAAENSLARARLDLSRTRLTLPYDVIVLERTRIAGEVVASRELLGRVTRADAYWLELRARPQLVERVRVRDGGTSGARVVVTTGETGLTGEVIRVRADLASGSRLAGIIASIPLSDGQAVPLLGTYVEAEVDAGTMDGLIEMPRRALHDNRRVWVVDSDQQLQVREAVPVWESGDTLYLRADALQNADQIVVSRISGQIPGTRVRARVVDLSTDQALAEIR